MRSDARMAALRAKMEAEEVAALIVTDPVNIAYLTGFEGVFDEERAHIAVITADLSTIYTDNRYSEAAATAAEGSAWRVRMAWPHIATAVSDDLRSAGINRPAMEDTAPRRQFETLSGALEGGATVAADWIEELRAVKEPEEIERIAAAQALTDRAFDHILGVIRPGATERAIALELEFFMRRNGSDGVAFPPIVASGPRSSLPHAKVTDRVIEPGDFLKMDFGARLGGYCADMTRTIVVGSADSRQRELYEAVLAANQAGIAAVGPDLSGREIDAAARSVLSDAGLGDQFTHGLGHGVGLEVHELPSVGPRIDKAVPLGAVITIEPGVYVPGFGGVRIEDLVVVEESGARVLTGSPKDLIEL